MTFLSKGLPVRTSVRYFFILSLSALLFSCTSADNGAPNATPETEDQKILNALGQALAQNALGADLSEEELGFVQRGLTDAILGHDALVPLDEYGPQIQGFMQQRMASAADGELALANTFMEEQASVDGAERTESGIVVQEITPGSGPSPSAEDTVQVHYHGTLRDGTVFDSSVDRGEPATFPLTGVIPCWTEGLQHIGVGGKSRLVCPPDLAYGPQGPPGIPGNSALVFEVELLEIVEN
jgi:FKBP-type peptidyl-prolyl cis-trans isomerase